MITIQGMAEHTGASRAQIQKLTKGAQFPDPLGVVERSTVWDREQIIEWFEENPVRTIYTTHAEREARTPRLDNAMATAFLTGDFARFQNR